MSQENLEEIGARGAPLSPDKPQTGAHPAAWPIVGLGASAGGLEAFQNFLSATPADAGLAYVLVQHLDPNHESMLAELLSRRTEMPVRQITDGMRIEPNCVYLIPPNASLTIERATLRLSEFTEPRGFRRPIDVFFRSLALDQGANAACIVLSGTGGDGSEGLRVVKEAGGLTLVQEPEHAKYDGMPKSAVATGQVDKVLDVREMPAALRDYFDRGQAGALEVPDAADFLLSVCEELRRRLGHDFSQYKRSTMLRRIQRRMQVVGASTGAAYLDRLKAQPAEADLLFRDLLINVTCFFRDAEAFDILRREVIPHLLDGKGAHDTVRIWSAGCSSGEEAYSLAIMISEHLGRLRVRPQVQIFATDIDEAMLQKARAACYPHTAVRDVPLELLDRYFYAAEDDFVLVQSIRDMVRISNHNLLKDPPFSRVDLVICRNLLIYLNANLQQRLTPVFHYALKPEGWLFLGSAENISARNDLFDTFDSANKIYRRRGMQRQSAPMPLALDPLPDVTQREARPMSVREKLDVTTRRIMERYAPAHVVVNPENDILHASTNTGRYLQLAEGAPSNNVTDMAKRGLRAGIRSVLEAARRSGKRAIKRDLRMTDADGAAAVDITADPLNDRETLLVFLDAATIQNEEDEDGVRLEAHVSEDHATLLENELNETRTRLRTTVEELETSNEELKSSNEEMMSMNEELQSANEELATVNEELKNKVEQLARANSDLQNFIESTQVPTIFLDRTMHIRGFTPASRALFRFQDGDRGRPLADVVSRVDHGQVARLSQAVLESGAAQEEDLKLDGDERFVFRALPYRDAHNEITGIILVFTDVTKIRSAQDDLARNMEISRQRGDEIVRLYETAPVGMALLDRNRRFLKINQHFIEVTGRTIDSHIGRSLADMMPALADRLEGPISEVFERGQSVTNIEAAARLKGDALQDLLIDFYPYTEDGAVIAVGIVLKDVTELRRLEKELRRLMDELQHRVKNTLATVASIVNQTVSAKRDRGELVTTLKRRIGALAATHDLLTKEDWRNASLRAILDSELSPYAQTGRVTIKGPEVLLPPKHALTLTLTLHELATNAAKYGALAQDGATLTVEWVVSVDDEGRRLNLKWIEKGVTLTADEVKDSFGAKLIKNAVSHDLSGKCDYRLRNGGLRCTLSLPF